MYVTIKFTVQRKKYLAVKKLHQNCAHGFINIAGNISEQSSFKPLTVIHNCLPNKTRPLQYNEKKKKIFNIS